MAIKQILEFPNFTKIKVSMKDEYESWYVNFRPYSDFSFNNLISWLNIEDSLHLARHESNMVFLLDNPFNKHAHTYSLVGKTNLNKTINELRKNGITDLEMVPEETVESLNNLLDFEITEDSDNNDYIYNFNDWVDWQKCLNKSTKSNVGKLAKNIDERKITVEQFDLSVKKNVQMVKYYSKLWEVKNVDTKVAKIQLEQEAIHRLLENAEDLDVKVLLIMSDGQPMSLMIYHLPVQSDFVIFNHLKCNYEFQGIFDFTFMCSVNYLEKEYPKRFKFFNAEQDLGIAGLKHHKQLMNPAYQLKRYSVKL